MATQNRGMRTSPAGLWSHGYAAQLGGALPGYTGFRDDRIDSLGQPGLAGAGASARPPVPNGRAKLVLMPSDVQPRKIIINGHPTSVRLEPAFWGWLREIAAECGVTAKAFIKTKQDGTDRRAERQETAAPR
jgi:hypothetical protein